VHDANAAVPRRCGETCDVGDHSPADADDEAYADGRLASAAIDALGRRVLFDHHAILLPTPF